MNRIKRLIHGGGVHRIFIIITVLGLYMVCSPFLGIYPERAYGFDGGYGLPTGGGGAAPVSGTTDIRGRINTEGRFLVSVTATSPDLKCILSIPKNTIGLTKDLKPLNSITIVPTSAPTGASTINVLGQIYDLRPDGATFDPPITLKFNYNPSEVPVGTDPVIHYWDAGAGEWVPFEGCVVDPVSGTVSVQISHFTPFTILAVEPAPAPAPEPTPAPEPAPAPAPPAKPAPAPPEKPTPAPAPAPPAKPAEPAPAPTAEPTPTPVTEPIPAPIVEEPANWGLIGGLIAAAIVIIGLLIYFAWWRRRLI